MEWKTPSGNKLNCRLLKNFIRSLACLYATYNTRYNVKSYLYAWARKVWNRFIFCQTYNFLQESSDGWIFKFDLRYYPQWKFHSPWVLSITFLQSDSCQSNEKSFLNGPVSISLVFRILHKYWFKIFIAHRVMKILMWLPYCLPTNSPLLMDSTTNGPLVTNSGWSFSKK